MPSATYIALANVTLGGNDNEIVFSNIPATYRDLVLVNNHLVTTNSNQIIRFNSDSGSNYPWVYLGATGGGTAVSGTNTSTSLLVEAIAASNTSDRMTTIVNILDYSATDKHKLALTRGGRPGQGTDLIGCRWANINAVHTISISLNNGASFITGSTFSLYGIAS